MNTRPMPDPGSSAELGRSKGSVSCVKVHVLKKKTDVTSEQVGATSDCAQDDDKAQLWESGFASFLCESKVEREACWEVVERSQRYWLSEDSKSRERYPRFF